MAERQRYVTDEIRWQAIFSHRGRRRVVYLRDGLWMLCARVVGQDTDCRDIEHRFRVLARYNASMLGLNVGHALWYEEQHNEDLTYHDVNPPCAATRAYEHERRDLFQSHKPHFVDDTFISLAYRPPAALLTRLERMLVDYDPEDLDGDSLYAKELDDFCMRFDQLLERLTFMEKVEPLENGALLTYLKSTISTVHQPVADIAWDEELPGQLVDQPFLPGLRLRLGHEHDRHDVISISVHNYPRHAQPVMLRLLRQLPFRYRRTVRWIPQARQQSDKEIARAWSRAAVARKPMGLQAYESINGNQGLRAHDPRMDDLMLDAADALRELERGTVRRGHMTQSINLIIPSGMGSMQIAQTLLAKVRETGLVAEIESHNAAEVYLGSIPGHAFFDVTRHGVNSAAACAMFPLDSPWRGEPWNKRLGCPAIMRATRGTCTPIDVNLHVHDVGHALITGGTGGGKTTLANGFLMGFRARVPHGQATYLTKGGGAKVTVWALGGHFADPMRDRRPFQPLRMLETPEDLAFASRWLLSIWADANPHSPHDRSVTAAVDEAIHLMATTMEQNERTLSAFMRVVQHEDMRTTIRPFTRHGIWGGVLDGVDRETWEAPIVAMEVGALLRHPRLSSATAALWFYISERRASPDRPMLTIGDEAQEYVREPYVGHLEAKFRGGRAQYEQIILISQLIGDYHRSDLSTVFTTNAASMICTPGDELLQPRNREGLEAVGLAGSMIDMAAAGVRKQEYGLWQPERGFAMFAPDFGPVALALCGSTDRADQQRAERLREEVGPENFTPAWLRLKGLKDAARFAEEVGGTLNGDDLEAAMGAAE